MKFSSRFFFLFLLAPIGLAAQQTFPQPAPSDPREGLFAFTNATIYLDYKTKLENATLLIRKGKVEACSQKVAVPKEAVVQDCTGKTIYPAFIDLYAQNYGLPETRPEGRQGPGGPGGDRGPQPLTTKKGPYSWNEALRPEYNVVDAFAGDAKAADEWRKAGFGTVLTHRADGISRGSGALVALIEGREHEAVLDARAAHFLSFRKGASTQDYPASLMGCIALLRQTYLDARWHQAGGFRDEKNLSLEAWNALQPLPQIFEASEKLDILRIARLGKEFGLTFLIKTAGDEYQRLDALKAAAQSLIVPLNFPEGYDVRDPYDAREVSLRELKHWEMAPSNPARLEAAGIPFALTAAGLKDKSKFWENLRKAVDYGLSEETALKALTWQPAQFLQIANQLNSPTAQRPPKNSSDQSPLSSRRGAGGAASGKPTAAEGVGTLQPGQIASFVLATGNLFKTETKIQQTWVKGQRFDVTPEKADGKSLLGQYQLTLGRETYPLTIKGKEEAPEAYFIRPDSSKVRVNLNYSGGQVSMSYQPDTLKKGVVTITGLAGEGDWSGQGTLPDGAWTEWQVVRAQPAASSAEALPKAPPGAEPARKPAATPVKPEIGEMIYPFTAFGWKEKPKAGAFLIRNATVWTNEKEGILTNTDVLVDNGKILRVGQRLDAPDNVTVVDGAGKHLTAGIVDEHSHIAVTRSVNEGTQESSAEVRIGDVLDSEDIDIYRQLAGGVTSSHLLHGSANPIGGQTQLIKLRWGSLPEELKFGSWPGYIKFALGENVKQSNWGDNFRTRYPQTRMGVEQVYTDYFTRAREYSRLKKSGQPYRTDLDLEALLEILEGKRFITCHSYVQSEITMLIRVAEQFGFKVNTFTHILEGYKVADKMAKHGAGGSTFSDWWAYKFEVYEAIPYNAKMMADRGVTVAINSDDAEMARRLNQEAAKSVLYGGMKEEDAWKMVTLNPAKLLRVDDRVGSIRAGKDADLVLWSASPLSIYAQAENTWVDGILFFDRAEDARRREWVRKERARLVQKLLQSKKGGEGSERPGQARRHHYHCDDVKDEG